MKNENFDLKVVGAIGKNYCIYIKENGKYAMYDRNREEHISEDLVDQQKIVGVLSGTNEESREVLKVL